MRRFLDWLSSLTSRKDAAPRRGLDQTGAHLYRTGSHRRPRPARPKQAVPERQPEFVELDPNLHATIDDVGPGKNVLIRNKYLREDTGTHETLTILDDSIIDTEEEEGIDPYNSGQFDRSNNWKQRR